jgi:hypothetical protein
MPDILTTALQLLDAGMSPVPIRAASKAPAIPWKQLTEHSADRDTTTRWFTDHSDWGLGVASGSVSGNLLMIEVEGRAADRIDELREMAADSSMGNLWNRLNTGWVERSPSGGVHWFLRTETTPDGNQKLARDPAGVVLAETRGEGGQTVIAPTGGTHHPSGQPWTLIHGGPTAVPTLTRNETTALLDLFATLDQTPTPTPLPTAPTAGPRGDRPGDQWAADTDWTEILTPHGWTLHHTDTDGTRYWTRPGKDPREGTSATTGHAQDGDRLFVFSTSTKFDANTPYTKLGALSVLDYDGDYRAAATALRARGYGAPDPVIDIPAHTAANTRPTAIHDAQQAPHGEETPPATSWQEIPLHDIVQGLVDGTLTTPTPTVGTVDGGTALFYPGCVNGIAGDSGCGKTWTALVPCAEEITAGRHVAYFDLEDTPAGIAGRLLDMGAAPEAITARFHYARPHDRFDQVARDAVSSLVHHYGVTLVVIDSTGEALSLQGADPNADEQVAAWFQFIPRFIADMGPAVVLLDHVTKANEDGLWPIGSQRKRAAINGAQYMQKAVQAFSRGKDGRAVLTVAKDRHGHYSARQKAAELTVTTRGSRVAVALRAPESSVTPAGEFRPTALMEKVSRVLEVSPQPMSGRELRDSVRGKCDFVILAVNTLISDGYVQTNPGPNRSTMHTSIRPYRQASVPGEHPTKSAPPDPGVPCSPSREGGTREHSIGTSAVFPGNTGEHSGNTDQLEQHNTPDSSLDIPAGVRCRVCGTDLLAPEDRAAGRCPAHQPEGGNRP